MSSLLERMAAANPVPPTITVSSGPEEKKEVVRMEKDHSSDKRFVIICSRDMSDSDVAIFREHGKVLKWKKESFLNIDFEELDFDFLLIDIREKEARLTLNRQDLNKYNKVAYVFAIQKGIDDFLNEMDTVDVSSIPEHAINTRDFKHQLMTQKITAPSLTKSFLRFLVRCFGR